MQRDNIVDDDDDVYDDDLYVYNWAVNVKCIHLYIQQLSQINWKLTVIIK